MVNLVLKECMKKGFLLDKEMLDIFNKIESDKINEIIDIIGNLKLKERVITRKIFSDNIKNIKKIMNGGLNDSVDAFFLELNEKKKTENINKKEEFNTIQVIKEKEHKPKIFTVNDFINSFRRKYNIIKDFLLEKEYSDITSIRKISKNSSFTIIGSVFSKRITKNKNIILEVEDMTGSINLLINKNKNKLYEQASQILMDSVLVFRGSCSSEMFFCNDIIFPEVKNNRIVKTENDCWVAFISDLHCGSVNFMEKNFLKFIKWINGKEKNIYSEISKNIKYLFIGGNLVDGIGHYVNQEKDLKIKNITKQYEKVQELFKLFRKDLNILVTSGDRDAVWRGEPQSRIENKWFKELDARNNITFLENPSWVKIENKINILLYHGTNIYNLTNEMPNIRNKSGFSSPNNIIKELLRIKQLSPMYGSVDIIPEEKDLSIIEPIPDIIFTGNLHRCEIEMKENILLINGSCWMNNTNYLDKKGILSDPCKVPLLNLRTREIKVLDFSDDSKQVKWIKDDNICCKMND